MSFSVHVEKLGGKSNIDLRRLNKNRRKIDVAFVMLLKDPKETFPGYFLPNDLNIRLV